MFEVQHIDIPFDQLGVFKNAHEDRYQSILIQTLLLTTKGDINFGNKSHKYQIFITTKSIWVCRKQQIKSILSIKSIVATVKSFKNPQIVILTDNQHDNLRISTSTEDRCWYIISTLSYVFTYVLSKTLCFLTIKHNTLDYFQRTKQDKLKGKNINIQPYTKQHITYQKPFKDISDIYGHIKPKSKIILQKQLQIQIAGQNSVHTAYLAKIKSQMNNSELQDRYICHYVEKKQEYMQAIYQHKNIDFITELVYAKTSDFKIQIFFQYSKSLRGTKLNTRIFEKIWKLYDKVKQYDKYCVVTTDSLLVVERKNMLGESNKMPNAQSDEQQRIRWIRGEYKIVMREFRYDFLNQAVEWDKFIFQDDLIDLSKEEKCQGRSEQNDLEWQSANIEDQENLNKIDDKTQIIEDKQYNEIVQKIVKQQELTSNTSQEILEQPKKIQNSRKKSQNISQTQKLINQKFNAKIYNIGLILYQLATGRNLFSYIPALINEDKQLEEQIQIIYHLKQTIKKQENIEIFPKYLEISISAELKNFIKSCIFRRIKHQEMLFQHPWLRPEKI